MCYKLNWWTPQLSFSTSEMLAKEHSFDSAGIEKDREMMNTAALHSVTQASSPSHETAVGQVCASLALFPQVHKPAQRSSWLVWTSPGPTHLISCTLLWGRGTQISLLYARDPVSFDQSTAAKWLRSSDRFKTYIFSHLVGCGVLDFSQTACKNFYIHSSV